MCKQNQKYDSDTEIIIQAMDHYLQEYIHRDTHMWSQNYKFFFSALIVILLPNLTDYLGISLPEKLATHSWIFPSIGIILSFVFLYVSLGLARRFTSVSETYNYLIKQLPSELQRKSIKDMPIKILNHSSAHVMSILMFISLLAIGVFSLF